VKATPDAEAPSSRKSTRKVFSRIASREELPTLIRLMELRRHVPEGSLSCNVRELIDRSLLSRGRGVGQLRITSRNESPRCAYMIDRDNFV